MGSESMANAARLALRQVWRSLHSSTHDAAKFRGTFPHLGGRLGNSPSNFMHRRELVEMSQSQLRPSVFHGDLLREQLQKNLNKNNNNSKDRLWLEQIRPPEITVEDARRLVRLVRLEAFKRGLQQIFHDCISYKELLQVCMESVEQCCEEEAVGFAKLLDESGHILISGHIVHLRPDKIARALEKVIGLSVAPKADPRREELDNLVKEKAKIDQEAEKCARAELWSGLGFFAVKTAILVRWTFWELSWDVMEPICFFLTSIYFMAGYVFFLRTSNAPTFEGFFKARFRARQKQLMKKRDFDVERFRELHMLFRPRFKPINSYNDL